TISVDLGPSDGLIALQFDFRILDEPMPTSITGGYLTLSFTPVPEPSAAALVALGAVALFGARRQRNRRVL
ncbi:MAG: PEP-CTERM sorting domain-containing protein, partial [Chloroflexaceae bacterium]|nr:PEP-CTERM sorting domain-containing protein [Chloroflexaceae bacterium]